MLLPPSAGGEVGKTMRFFYYMTSAAFLIFGALSIGKSSSALVVTVFFCGLVLMGWSIMDSIWYNHNTELMNRADLTAQRAKFVQSIAAADSDVRSFLALEWPELGVNDVEVQPAIYLLHHGMNTNILLPCFQRFLKDSDEREFADMRRYNDDKSLQEQMSMSREAIRVQWDLTTRHLAKKGYLSPNSAMGSHSFLWVTKQHYYRMVQWYLNSADNLPDFGEQAE